MVLVTFFFIMLHGMWDPGSLPGDRTCTCPLHWKLRVLTIGPPGKSQSLYLHMGPVGVSVPESKAPDA